MEARRRTWFDERGLVVAARRRGRSRSTRARCTTGASSPRAGRACLRAMHAHRLTLVETYVPWRVHEPRARPTSSGRGARDLARFSTPRATAGLAVVLRPGPHVNAELDGFGIPDWVLADPACQARTAHGTPAWMPSPPRAFPIPSYASTAFHAHVRAWYARGRRGRDSRSSRPTARRRDRRRQRGADVLPPRRVRPRLPPRRARVVARGERARRAAARVGSATTPRAARVGALQGRVHRARARRLRRSCSTRSASRGSRAFTTCRRGTTATTICAAIQHAIGGPVGIDAYTARSGLSRAAPPRAALLGDASPMPLALEVGVGFFPWLPPLDREDDPTRERDHLLTLLAAGVRGFNLFMAVERDRYYGAAISTDGQLEERVDQAAVRALAEVDWPSLRAHAAIALVDTRADARFGIAHERCSIRSRRCSPRRSVSGPAAPPSSAPMRPRSPRGAGRPRSRGALELAQVPYAIVDEAADRGRARALPRRDRTDARPHRPRPVCSAPRARRAQARSS